MRLSTLQIGLIVAGVLLVIGVLVYNALVERRIRRKIASTFDREGRPAAADMSRVEPSLRGAGSAPTSAQRASIVPDDDAFAIPMDAVETLPDPGPPTIAPTPKSAMADALPPVGMQPQPDPEIESVATLQPARPVGAAALAAGLHARLGKPLRWFGRRDGDAAWQRIATDTTGEFSEVAACLLLADRNGAASRAQLETFQRVIAELAPTLPAAWTAAPVEDEAARAEELDRLCAELDMQIGLTIQRPDGSGIPGTKLRGVAEAAGFRLAPSGRFECVHEDTGGVLYTLQGTRGEAFTLDTLRVATIPGVVLVLDVPRVPDPAKTFDQLKLAARRMAQTLGGELVDDNGRPLGDDKLASIRREVAHAAELLDRARIEPGSPRAHKLFAA